MVVAYATGQTSTLMAFDRTTRDLGMGRGGDGYINQPQNRGAQNGYGSQTH